LVFVSGSHPARNMARAGNSNSTSAAPLLE
jgi:hypothetical protein